MAFCCIPNEISAAAVAVAFAVAVAAVVAVVAAVAAVVAAVAAVARAASSFYFFNEIRRWSLKPRASWVFFLSLLKHLSLSLWLKQNEKKLMPVTLKKVIVG